MNKDNKLIWESLDDRNKWRGPGAPGVQMAKGYVLQALDLIEDDDVHLCADINALEQTIESLLNAVKALSHDKHEVPGADISETREAPDGKHYTRNGALKSGDADADGSGGPKFRSDPTDKPGKGD